MNENARHVMQSDGQKLFADILRHKIKQEDRTAELKLLRDSLQIARGALLMIGQSDPRWAQYTAEVAEATAPALEFGCSSSSQRSET